MEEELENLFDLLGLELLMDGIEIFRLVFPESDLDERVGVTVFKSLLWLEFQNILDLFSPHNNTSFKDMRLVLLRDVISLGQLVRGSWQLGLAVDLAHRHKGLREIIVEFLDEVLGDQFGPLT